MKKYLCLFFCFPFIHITHSQVLDGIYTSDSYQSRLPQIYQTFFSIQLLDDSLWRENLYRKAEEIKLKYVSQKFPVFNDMVFINVDPTVHFDRKKNFLLFQTAHWGTSRATFKKDAYAFGAPVLAYDTDSMGISTDSLMNIFISTSFNPEKYLEPFYFRQYEVTNKEYREFTNWVRDSIARRLLAMEGFEEYLLESENADLFDRDIYSRRLNWKIPINWNSEDQNYRMALDQMYLPEQERYYRRKELDTRKW